MRKLILVMLLGLATATPAAIADEPTDPASQPPTAAVPDDVSIPDVLTLRREMLTRLPDRVRGELRFLSAARDELIERVIIPGGVSDQRVLEAVRLTPRHRYVPQELRAQAYLDRALPIGEAQTISSPYIVAVMTEALDPQPTDKVLEIGTGSGYQASVLAPLVDQVYSIEIVEDLARRTQRLLEGLGYTNIHTRIGDGYLGWPEAAPFDKIIVTCSPSAVPQPLVDQLKEGGLMAIPVGTTYQQLLHIFRKRDGQLEQVSVRPTLFVPMTGTADEQRGDAMAVPLEIVNGDFETLPDSGDYIPGWYYEFNAAVVEDPESPAGPRCIEFRSDRPESPNLILQGFRCDAREHPKVILSGAVKCENIQVGKEADWLPKISLRMLDENREVLGYYWLGNFSGTHPWQTQAREFKLHPRCREAIIQIGLFGATGTARFDGIEIRPAE